jgi:hypothetical protein
MLCCPQTTKMLIHKSLLHIIRLALIHMIQIIIKVTHKGSTLRHAGQETLTWKRTIATQATWGILVQHRLASQTCHPLCRWEALLSLSETLLLLQALNHTLTLAKSRIRFKLPTMKMSLHRRGITQLHLKVCPLLHQWWTNLPLPLTTCILQVAAQSKDWIVVVEKTVLSERKPDYLLIDPNQQQSVALRINRLSVSGSLA